MAVFSSQALQVRRLGECAQLVGAALLEGAGVTLRPINPAETQPVDENATVDNSTNQTAGPQHTAQGIHRHCERMLGGRGETDDDAVGIGHLRAGERMAHH
jgi:hypothetical protein